MDKCRVREPFSLLQLAGMKKRLLSSPRLSASSGVFEVGEKKNILRLGQFSGGTSLCQNFVKAQMLVNL